MSQEWADFDMGLCQTTLMPEVKDIVRTARNAINLSQEALARAAGISKGAVQNIETGETIKPNGSTLAAIARGLGMNTWEEVIASVIGVFKQSHGGRGIPILADIPASFGTDGEVNGETFGRVEVDGELPANAARLDSEPDFALVVRGDSMAGWINPGDTVICSARQWYRHGFVEGRVYAIRKKNDETTLKRVHLVSEDEIDLIPDNQAHPRCRVSHDDVALAALVVARVLNETGTSS